ncbi:TlpA family protein disulfide reductase [Marinilabiliaceae bacterium JC017]|nr:TlpA family protein disulfide reductase [Marinilabiliaceae bacterium JC017]
MRNTVLLVLVMVLFSFCTQKESGEFTLQGSGFEQYEGMEVVFQFLNVEDVKSPFTKQGGKIEKGGFIFADTINEPQEAIFIIKNETGRFQFLGKFLVEPGKLQMEYQPDYNDVKVTGDVYNKVFNEWFWSTEFMAMNDEIRSLYKEGMTQEELQAVQRQAQELGMKINEKVVEKMQQIIDHNSDPYMRAIALNRGGFLRQDREYALKVLAEIEKEHGANITTTLLRNTDEKWQNQKVAEAVLKVGEQIKSFSANGIDGKTYHLGEMLKANKYTLVEFWASWCGPCRNEIPHMKKAFENYKDKGFGIFSFSIDTKKEKWEKATREDEIPWINTSDLKASKSPVVKQFGINGIPKNYLVDEAGKIIAIDLRGSKLEEKLAELLQ